MDSPQRYRPIHRDAEAMQYTGRNLTAIIAWLPFEAQDDNGLEVWHSPDEYWRPVWIGNWVVRDHLGRIFIIEARDFADIYEHVTQIGD